MRCLAGTVRMGWPRSSLTIRAEDIYHRDVDEDPFDVAANWITLLQCRRLDRVERDRVNKEIHDTTIRAIFGSNMIANVGLVWDFTLEVCLIIIAEKAVAKAGEPSNSVPGRFHACREVIQHAEAYKYLLRCFVAENTDLTEPLIQTTHRILTNGVPLIRPEHFDVPPEKYGGIYRTAAVGTGRTHVTLPRDIPKKMKEMCASMAQELATAEEMGCIDPFSVAAKYSKEFVQIYPFQGGNGRMCRMILNVILCRYAGIVIPIGEEAEEREEYMRAINMEGHGEYATFVLRRAATRLREMRRKLAGKGKWRPEG